MDTPGYCFKHDAECIDGECPVCVLEKRAEMEEEPAPLDRCVWECNGYE